MYKLMYENAASSNEKLLTLTQWTLGVSLAIVLGIIASQVYFNYRINKKELDSISSDIQQELSRLKLEIAQKINEDISRSATSLEMNKLSVSRELQLLIEKQFTSNEKMMEMELRNQKSDLMFEIRQLRRSAKKNEGDIWASKNVKSNALTCYIEVAELEIGLLNDEQYTLKEMIKILAEMEDISHADYEKLNILLSKIKAYNSDLKVKITQIISEKPTYQFVKQNLSNHFLFNMPLKQFVRNKPK